jgi:enterochelin esterase-like enzyme
MAAVVGAAVALGMLIGGAAGVLARGRSPRGRGPRARAAGQAQAAGIACPSPSLGRPLPAEVYLPPGYNPRRGRRYPVIYFLHGLPAGPGSYLQNGFVAAALAAAGQPAIVVTPQGAPTPDSDREYLDWSPEENWPQAISEDLTRCIDGRYRTIADRYGRALMGLSAGGYGAVNIGLRNLQTFSAVESWSGYFEATGPRGDHLLQLGSAQAQSAATVPTGAALKHQLAAWPSLLGFYVGRQDSRFLAMNEQYNASLSHSGIRHTFAVYPGGHTYALWRGQAHQWLTLALRYMTAGQRRSSSNDSGGAGL